VLIIQPLWFKTDLQPTFENVCLSVLHCIEGIEPTCFILGALPRWRPPPPPPPPPRQRPVKEQVVQSVAASLANLGVRLA
jgi:hypothetical protein